MIKNTMERHELLIISVLAFSLNVQSVTASVIYVDQSANGANDGTSWKDAFVDLHQALSTAVVRDEIWVADGTYKPASVGGDRLATFTVKSGVSLFGGFEGIEESVDQRNPERFQAILSGDLNSNDTDDPKTLADNSFHVVTASGVDSTALIDGFIISSGNAMEEFPNSRGAGLIAIAGSPVVRACIFVENQAITGSAAYLEGSNAMVFDSVFANNGDIGIRSSLGHPVFNGCVISNHLENGLFVSSGTVDVLSCVFLGNGTTIEQNSGGGALIFNFFEPATIIASVFMDNMSSGGGGLNVNGDIAIIANCLFVGNSAFDGGAMSLGSDSALANCTIVGNSASFGGGIFDEESDVEITNSIVFGNTSSALPDPEEGELYYYQAIPKDPPLGKFIVNHSIVEDWSGRWGGPGNNGNDPLFVDSDAPDDIPGTEDDDLRLSAGSPAIDSGDSTAVPADEFDLDEDGDLLEPIPFDLDGLPRFVDDPKTPDTGIPLCEGKVCLPVVDRGAYEFQTACVGDANGDRLIDPLDSGFVLARLNCPVGQGNPLCDAADANLDGIVDPIDVGYVLSRFGECP